jgi:hypothetical protein
MMGPGLSFDEDDVIANNDDEDLQKDPVSLIDLRVSTHTTGLISLFLIRFLCFCRRTSRRLFVRVRRRMQVDLGSLLINSVRKR